MSLEKPLVGHGLMAGLKYKDDASYTELQNINLGIRTPHNIHLQVIFDLGSVGAVLILMSFIWPVWRWHTSGNYGEASRLGLWLALYWQVRFSILLSGAPGFRGSHIGFLFLWINATKMKLSDVR